MGTLVKDGTKIVYTVKTVDNITRIIIPHFDNYPLLTKKFADFVLFKQIVLIMANKGHLDKDSLDKIMNLRANLNLGISEKLKIAFPRLEPVSRPEVLLKEIPDPH